MAQRRIPTYNFDVIDVKASTIEITGAEVDHDVELRP